MAGCTYLRKNPSRVSGWPTGLLHALATGVFLLGGASSSRAAHAATTISGVRFWSLGDVTRVAIEADSEFKFQASRLTNPDRLFFDIQDAHPDSTGAKTIAVGDGLLKRIRIAETQRGVTRVVLDLEQDADYQTSQTRGPVRLMIEMRPRGSGSGQPKEKSRQEPKLEPVELAAGFTGPKRETRPQVPRPFVPPPVELLPPPPAGRTKFPPLAYLTPPPAFGLFAKPTKLPRASLPSLPRPPAPVREVGRGAGQS